ncbi:MAG TPA: 3-phosphoshikimate 1-carboxyvinyltransferase [Sphingobacteriaceae bacterium]|nr:3-phosphoshikimate 1-carboxyvinyltransferase [Sphingobacteriaceae bacterium]
MTKRMGVRVMGKTIQGRVPLTGSKSESNRALMLKELSLGAVRVKNCSEADDTQLMIQALKELKQADPQQVTTIDIGPAGTVMRFMTALLSIRPGQYLLTGSERMKQRPIALLVDALHDLGAKISYENQPGFPPLRIHGGFDQRNNEVSIAGDVSSQYLSALLMIAPALPQGLHLKIVGQLTSKPYLSMTLELMESAGIRHTWVEDVIHIPKQGFSPAILTVEPDWSAASYWYSVLAQADEGELFLPGLKQDSLQGDQAISQMMERFGVYSTFTSEGVKIIKGELRPDDTLLDFTPCPDLAQTVIACAAALKKDLSVTGLHTLRIKETDRIAALQNELEKFGARLIEQDQVYHLDTSEVPDDAADLPALTFDTYEDHRMAMAFAPLALSLGPIQINDPEVVIKSYPDFWVHLRSMGFQIEEK